MTGGDPIPVVSDLCDSCWGDGESDDGTDQLCEWCGGTGFVAIDDIDEDDTFE